MALYAVIGLDHPPHSMDLRDRFRPEHRAYYKETLDQHLQFAGALLDDDDNPCGTLLIFEAESAGQPRALLANEPFCKEGVYKDLHIIRWFGALNRLPAVEWNT